MFILPLANLEEAKFCLWQSKQEVIMEERLKELAWTRVIYKAKIQYN